MDLKEQIKTAISETCTHWLISDDAELKKVSKKLSKEFETIIKAEIERRQPVLDTEANDSKHAVIKSLPSDEDVDFMIQREFEKLDTTKFASKNKAFIFAATEAGRKWFGHCHEGNVL